MYTCIVDALGQGGLRFHSNLKIGVFDWPSLACSGGAVSGSRCALSFHDNPFSLTLGELSTDV